MLDVFIFDILLGWLTIDVGIHLRRCVYTYGKVSLANQLVTFLFAYIIHGTVFMPLNVSNTRTFIIETYVAVGTEPLLLYR
jgi:hypothetical protein